jgi:hypothetical protein
MEVIAQQARNANAQDSLLLSKLPGEIRKKIYRLAFVSI